MAIQRGERPTRSRGSISNTAISNFLGQYLFQSDGDLMRRDSSKAGNDISAAFSLNFPNEPSGGDIVVKQIGVNFTRAFGFINRTDIRSFQGKAEHLSRFRGRYLNQLELGTEYLLVTDLGNRLASRENDLYRRVASNISDEVTFKPGRFRKRASGFCAAAWRTRRPRQVSLEQFRWATEKFRWAGRID
jgi:hypothetical protein